MPKCSFCGKTRKVDDLVQGEFGLMCADCVRVSKMLLKRRSPEGDVATKEFDSSNPLEVKRQLDLHVIGQENAKKLLSIEICNHVKRIRNPKSSINKTNIMLVGPSGSGKTFILETLAKIVDVPLAVADATTFTEAGYAGKDVQSCLMTLLDKAGYDQEKAEGGIIFIDEADKIVAKSSNHSDHRDIRGEGVQQALLKMIENSEVEMEIRNPNGTTNYLRLNTKNILFIFGGSFDGIDRIVTQRQKRAHANLLIRSGRADTCGYNAAQQEVKPSDIIQYGFIKEFVGRVPLVVTLHKLSTEHMMNILTSAEHSILNEYQEMFRFNGIKVNFEDDALRYVVEEADTYGVGARGIRAVMSRCLGSILFDVMVGCRKELTITREVMESYIGQ